MQIDVHAVAMVQTPACVEIRLPKIGQRQRAVELRQEKLLDLFGLSKSPPARTISRFGSFRFGFGFWIFDASDAGAIDKRGDVSALVPVTVRAFAHFIDDQVVTADQHESYWKPFFSGRWLGGFGVSRLGADTRSADQQKKGKQERSMGHLDIRESSAPEERNVYSTR